MELDDLKQKWTEYDAKLDKSLRLNLQILRDSGLARVGAALRPLSVWMLLEALMDFAVVYLLGSFLGDHIGEPRFAVPAALLLLCAIASLNASIRQWATLWMLDYGAPIVAIQKRLAAVRVGRIRTTKWIFFVSPLLWTPLLIVAFKGLTGVDPYPFLDAKWLAGNVLFGIAFLAGTLWLSKRFGDRWKTSPGMQRFLDDVAGRSLAAATGRLGEIARFEREP